MREIIKKLQNDIERYDKILFFDSPKLLRELCRDGAMKSREQKVLVLSTGRGSFEEGNFTFRQLTDSEARLLKALYDTYDFSDKFVLVAERACYAGLYNFVATGLLSREDMVYFYLIGFISFQR